MQRLDDLVTSIEEHPDPGLADRLVEVLRAVDVLHRGALHRVGALLDAHGLREQALGDPDVALLFGLYEAQDEDDDMRSRSEAAVADIRPVVESHDGRLEVVAAEDGVVTIRLLEGGSSCWGSSPTLQAYVEDALRAALPEFVRMDVSDVPAHPPSSESPAPVLIPVSAIGQRGRGAMLPGGCGGGGCGSSGGAGTGYGRDGQVRTDRHLGQCGRCVPGPGYLASVEER